MELLVTIAIRPPLRQGELGQARDRMDLERGADAEQQVGARARAAGPASIASAGRSSPNRTTSGFTLPAQHAAGRDPVLVEQRLDLLELEARASQLVQLAVAIEPWTSITSLRPRLAVKAVDVLGDHRVQQAAPLELGQRLVGRVRPLVGERVEAGPVEVPEAPRCRGERRRSWRPTSGRPSPTAPPRGSGSRGSPTAPRSPPR